jgi:hypothetical protein
MITPEDKYKKRVSAYTRKLEIYTKKSNPVKPHGEIPLLQRLSFKK